MSNGDVASVYNGQEILIFLRDREHVGMAEKRELQYTLNQGGCFAQYICCVKQPPCVIPEGILFPISVEHLSQDPFPSP